jgi:hypothetical protein
MRWHFICIFGLVGLARAEVIRVPADQPTIQRAIDAAADGDEIVIAEGVYRESLVIPGSIGSLSLRSATPGDDGVVTATVLSGDADGDGVGDHRILLVDSPDDGTVITLTGLTFADGVVIFEDGGDAEPFGGAVRMEGGMLEVESCVFFRNRVDGLATSRGGAIAFANGTLRVRGSRFEGNERNPRDTNFEGYPINGGGAIHGMNATLDIRDSIFENNIANHAAAVHGGENVDLSIERCLVRGNRVFSDAIILLESGAMRVVATDVLGNIAQDFCAGIKSRNGTSVLIESCRIERNENAFGRQGVLIALPDTEEVIISNTIIRNNMTRSLGALTPRELVDIRADRARVFNTRFIGNRGFGSVAIRGFASDAVTMNCLFIGHQIESSPHDGVTPTVINSTFIGAPEGFADATPTSYTSCVSTYDLVRTSRGGLAIGSATHSLYPNEIDQPSDAGPGNINDMPQFLRNPDHGGDGWGDDPLTPDFDESANDDYGDLRLVPGSPAIDAGDNTAVPPNIADLDGDGDIDEPTPIDIAGNPRFLDDPDTPDTGLGPAPIVDLGAYEFDGTCSVADLATPKGSLDIADMMAFIKAFENAASEADLALPFGLHDLADVVAFVESFSTGCL